jgi:hypothetical protein
VPGLTIQLAETENRECFFHFTIATDTGNIKTVFKSVHTIIINNILKDFGLQ